MYVYVCAKVDSNGKGVVLKGRTCYLLGKK